LFSSKNNLKRIFIFCKPFRCHCSEAVLFLDDAEAVSKFKPHNKNNIPLPPRRNKLPKATKELKDMGLRQWSDKLLFLLFLLWFHVPAYLENLEMFTTLQRLIVAGTVECRNNPLF